ncbi:hypothetical protein SALBM217S_02259 [Streptomyces griseoloalbus]
MLERRLAEAVDPSWDPAEVTVLLVGRGSTDPDANAEVFEAARLLWEGRGYAGVETAFVLLAAPDVPSGLDRSSRRGVSAAAASDSSSAAAAGVSQRDSAKVSRPSTSATFRFAGFTDTSSLSAVAAAVADVVSVCDRSSRTATHPRHLDVGRAAGRSARPACRGR